MSFVALVTVFRGVVKVINYIKLWIIDKLGDNTTQTARETIRQILNKCEMWNLFSQFSAPEGRRHYSAWNFVLTIKTFKLVGRAVMTMMMLELVARLTQWYINEFIQVNCVSLQWNWNIYIFFRTIAKTLVELMAESGMSKDRRWLAELYYVFRKHLKALQNHFWYHFMQLIKSSQQVAWS